MLICLLVYLLISNAVTLKRDRSVLFSRVLIKSLLFARFLAFNNLFTQQCQKCIHTFWLYNSPTFTQTFNVLYHIFLCFLNTPITINSALSSTRTISIFNLLLIVYIYIPDQWFNVVSILTLLFKT